MIIAVSEMEPIAAVLKPGLEIKWRGNAGARPSVLRTLLFYFRKMRDHNLFHNFSSAGESASVGECAQAS
jgi:hypothetical protein